MSYNTHDSAEFLSIITPFQDFAVWFCTLLCAKLFQRNRGSEFQWSRRCSFICSILVAFQAFLPERVHFLHFQRLLRVLLSFLLSVWYLRKFLIWLFCFIRRSSFRDWKKTLSKYIFLSFFLLCFAFPLPSLLLYFYTMCKLHNCWLIKFLLLCCFAALLSLSIFNFISLLDCEKLCELTATCNPGCSFRWITI